MSMEIISPSSTRAIFPPTAASGDTCPMEAPLDAPEKRPSVIKATESPSPIPAIAEVDLTSLSFQDRPFGPS